MEKTSEIIARRKRKIADLKRAGIDLFPNDFVVSHTVEEIREILAGSSVTVTEDEIERAMRVLAEGEHLVVEGAGAVALAAILSEKVDPAVRRPVALVTGANVDLSVLVSVVTRGR